MRLLLVEDEAKLAEALSYQLRHHSYLVDCRHNGEAGLESALSGIYDLLILDRMLPKLDGLTLLKEFRAQGHKTPVLFLTAKDTYQDRVAGLDAGADDYMVKPFSTEELLARIRALGRRLDKDFVDDVIALGSLRLDPLRSLVYVADRPVHLSAKEMQLLELLMRNHKQVLTKNQIFFKIWGNSNSDFANVDLYVHYLRRKLPPDLIKTIRGIGYSLEIPSS
ncbi:response regulator transcription factor [Azotosporobacter soli]|uniref:response regulator transcription factor n=1 Tax=Azotosporobacter soli TaxID=3055040 RepID=UPI0031FED513